jgi:stage II sporulation protein D
LLSNVKNKGIGPFYAKVFGTVLLFLLLLPYIITSFFGNISAPDLESSASVIMKEWETESGNSIFIENVTTAGREIIPMEAYLVDKLARTMNTGYNTEALKAQAVLLRTALVWELKRIGSGVSGNIRIEDNEYGRGIINEDIVMAVVSTQGVILTYQDSPAQVAYFAVSNGRTRDSSKVLGQASLPYLIPVDCNRDFLAENFTAKKSISKNEFVSAIKKATDMEISADMQISDLRINRDENGYIIDITIAASPAPVTLSGEECRYIWGLNSSCFTIEENKNRITFSVRGVGHGLGMSQFAANEMAKSDSDYISILGYFFSGTNVTKID